VGSYMVLRGLAFMGDAISHAAFPGVVMAYLFGGSLYLGGAIAAVATALGIGWISRRAHVRSDTIIGVLFAGMFGLGVAIYSAIPNYVGDLFGFLFGDVLGIGLGDLVGLAVLGGIVLVVIRALWKQFLFARFDPLGAAASSLNVNGLDYLFLGLIALTIVVSIQAVGIILVVAMLTTPAATAQLLTARFGSRASTYRSGSTWRRARRSCSSRRRSSSSPSPSDRATDCCGAAPARQPEPAEATRS